MSAPYFVVIMVMNGLTGAFGAVASYFNFQTAVLTGASSLARVGVAGFGVFCIAFAVLCFGLAGYIAWLGYLPEAIP